MLLSSSCLRLFHVPKRYQKAITIMVLTLYCVNVAHPLTCTEHGQLTTKALQLRQLAFWVFVFVCIFPVANRLVVHIMSGDAQFVFILYLFYSSGYLSPIRSALIDIPFSDKDILSIDKKILLARLEEKRTFKC